jgi:hypothetical protein
VTASTSPETRLEMVDGHTVRMVFPEPDGQVLGKFRGFHLPSTRFWEEEGSATASAARPKAIGA